MLNNITKGHKTYGGARPITNGINWALLPVGYSVDPSVVPDIDKGHLPAGMLLVRNDVNHSAVPFKTAKVVSQSGTKITIPLVDGFCLSPFVVGDYIMKLGADFTTAGTGVKITAIDEVSGATQITTATSLTLSVDDVIINCDSAGKPFGDPNAMLYTDVAKDNDSIAINVTAAIGLLDSVIFENRIPVIPDLAKASLLKAGCNFTFSNSK